MKILHENTQWPWPKHEGKATLNVVLEDASHVLWMIENVFSKQGYMLNGSLTKVLTRELEVQDVKTSKGTFGTNVSVTEKAPEKPQKTIHARIVGRVFETQTKVDYVKRSKDLSGKAYSVSRRQKKQRA